MKKLAALLVGMFTVPVVATLSPASAATLPLYPAAKALATQMHKPFAFCGTKMTTVVYRVQGVDAPTVAKWYETHIPGGRRVDLHVEGAGTNIEIFQPDGRAAATVSHLNYGSLTASAKSFGLDHTTLGLVTFEPALPREMVDMLSSAARGDAGARARMKSRCADAGA